MDHPEATHQGLCVRPADLLLACQVCVQTSTSAGLDRILPWLFYHKVISVAHFLLFIEGKAANPSAAGVLESIPVRSSLEILKNPVVPISLCLFSMSDSVSLLLL